MKRRAGVLAAWLIAATVIATGCGGGSTSQAPKATPDSTVHDKAVLRVIAVESFLADVSQNVAGDRLKVDSLMPTGVDPHAFQPAPADIARITESDVVVVNGSGLETFLGNLLDSAGGNHVVIEASARLTSRAPREGEVVEAGGTNRAQIDPHFWLNPLNTIQYVQNIRDGLSKADPAGAAVYASNSERYIVQLRELDAWITDQVKQIPPQRRLLVTNHESLGYFADRYGLTIVGTIVPSVSSEASPSAQQLARLVDKIKTTGAPAIFLESGSSAKLADQVAQERGIQVVTDLYTESLTGMNGTAPTYLAMMRHDTDTIVNALK